MVPGRVPAPGARPAIERFRGVAFRAPGGTFVPWFGPGTGHPLRTSYHQRFPTLDYQEAVRKGAIDEYARYIFTRNDFPEPPATEIPGKGSND